MMILLTLAAALTLSAPEARCAAAAADLLASVTGADARERQGTVIELHREGELIKVTASLPPPLPQIQPQSMTAMPAPPPPMSYGGVGHFICDASGKIIDTAFEK